MPGSFFDTNVLVYLASDPERAARTRELLASGGTISVQVLNEIANVVRRKLGFTWSETRQLLSMIQEFVAVVPVPLRIHEDGLALAQRYRLSVYDGMILAAALSSGCDTLWSEDMQDGQVINGRLTVLNPFPRRPRE